MKLHIMYPSANCHAPMALGKKLGMDLEWVDVYSAGFDKPPACSSDEFKKTLNPCHCCPTLELDDGTGIWESNAIMRYMLAIAEDKEKAESLYPSKDLVLRAKLDIALDWRQTVLYPKLPSIGYCIFGFNAGDEEAKKNFKALMDEAFPTLTGHFLKDTKFIYSDTPTIADLAVGLPLTFIMPRKKFWEQVPEAVKEYRLRVQEAFPEAKDNYAILEGMAEGYSGDGADLEP